MNVFSALNTADMAFFTLGGLFLFLLGTILFLQYRNSIKIQKLTFPVYDYTVKKAQEKAHKIVWDAMRQARALLVDAELQGLKRRAKRTIEAEHVEEKYEDRLEELMHKTEQLLIRYSAQTEKKYAELGRALTGHMEEHRALVDRELHDIAKRLEETKASLDEQIKNTEGEYKELSESLRSAAEARAKKAEAVVEESTAHAMDSFAAMLSKMEADGRTRLEKHIEDEMAETKKAIERYRTERMKLIDNKILALVEETTAIALGRQLSAKEHADLIFRSLEEAKQKGVFE